MRSNNGPRSASKGLAALLLVASLGAVPARSDDLPKIQALAERGRTEEALKRLESALVADPAQFEGQLLRGVLLAELGRTGEAERAFRLLGSQYPDRPEPAHNLAVLEALGGRPATAILALEDLIDRYPGYDTAVANLDRIRRGAGGGFDPLNPEAPRLPLALTRRPGSYLEAPRAAATTAAEPAAVEEPPAEPMVAVPAEPMPTAPAAAALETEPQPGPPLPEAAPTEVAPPAAEPEPPPLEAPPTPESPVAPETAPVVPAPEPAAAPEAEPPAPEADLRARLEPVVTAWAAAWSEQRLKEYLAFYADDFEPSGYPSRAAWAAVRRQRLAAPAFIEVEVDLESMSVRETGPGEAAVTFVQSYRSDRYADTVRKSLDLVLRDGAWRIRRESSQ